MLGFVELRHLRYFAAVAEEENVSRAALKLHVSQPGLSRQIHDLEDEIGFPLFHRSAKSVRLTEAGRAFLDGARDVMRRAEEAVKAARAVAEGAPGEINVGYAPSLTSLVLPRALRAFQSKFPRVRVALHDLSTEEILTQLRDGRIQLGLMVRPPPRMLSGLEFVELAQYPLRVAMAPNHPLAKAKALRLAQVAAQQLIAYSRTDYPEYHSLLEALFAPARLKPRIAEEHDGVTGIIAAVEGGGGVAIVPSSVERLVGRRMKLVPIAESTKEVVVGAVFVKRTNSMLVIEFVAAAR